MVRLGNEQMRELKENCLLEDLTAGLADVMGYG